ncbi:hypothetical protein [Tsuneonella sp. HG222]
MFEGKPPKSGAATPVTFEGELRPVSWSDLVARLDAVRGLRAGLEQAPADRPGSERDASFDPGSARHIAALPDGKHGVNLDVLADGKAAGDISLPHEHRSAGGDPRDK